MRGAFRGSDKLFRFGGEEFVVMLRNVPADTVASIFERFRALVETHDFPQVGTVTCSIGFAQSITGYRPPSCSAEPTRRSITARSMAATAPGPMKTWWPLANW